MSTSTSPRAVPARSGDGSTAARTGTGGRQAFALLYHDHVEAVYVRGLEQGLDPVRAARLVRAVFEDLQTGSPQPDATDRPGARVRAAATARLAAGPSSWPRLGPATTAAARTSGVVPSTELRDRLWREVDGTWRRSRRTLWQRHGPTIVGAVGLGALVTAVAVVGAMVLDELRPVAPTEAVALTAKPVVELAEAPQPPAVAPSVIVPPAPTQEPTEPATVVPPSPTEDAEPTPEPTPEPTTTEPTPEPTATDAPPSVAIESPSDGQRLEAHQTDGGWAATVDLAASATDPEDDADGLELTYRWTSDRDGELATGPTATGVQLSFDGDCPVAGPTRHTITVSVTDSAGNTATTSVAVTITCSVLNG